MQLIHSFKEAFLLNQDGRVVLNASSNKFNVYIEEILENVEVFQTNIGIKIKADLWVTNLVEEMPLQEAIDKKIIFATQKRTKRKKYLFFGKVEEFISGFQRLSIDKFEMTVLSGSFEVRMIKEKKEEEKK